MKVLGAGLVFNLEPPNGMVFVNEGGLTGWGHEPSFRLMKFFWSVAVMVGALGGGMPVAGQDTPASGGGFLDQNMVVGVVGGRVITKWDVMRRLDRKRPGFSSAFNELAAQLREAKEQLKSAASSNEQDRLKAALDRVDSLMAVQLSTFRGEQLKMMDDQVLVEQVKAQPNYQEPPGLVDYIMSARIKANKDGLTGLIRQLQSEGRTMEMLRREVLDDWISRQVVRELSQQVIVSPKQVRDKYRAEFASQAGKSFDVADMYLMRLEWDNTKVATLRPEVEKLVASIKSKEEFMAASKDVGSEGDGPQGLISLNLEANQGELDRRRKGSLPGTPDIDALPTVERSGLLRDAHFRRLMVKVTGMKRGEAGYFLPLGGSHVFVIYVNEVIRGYQIPLEDQQKQIHADLFARAMLGLRDRKVAEARKQVFSIDYLDDENKGEISLLNVPKEKEPPPVPAPPAPPQP